MKYFVLGALASGFLLYGLSMMYGATGSLDITEVFKAIGTGQVNKQVLVFGLVFIVAGLAFKLGAVPFHMWVPDVYQGAPTAVTLLIGGAPELAAFAITIRLLVEGLLRLALDWQQMLMCWRSARWWSATSRPSRRPTSSACWPIRPSRQMGFMLLGLCPGVVSGNTLSARQRLQLGDVLHRHLRADHAGTFGMIMLLARAGLRERGDRRPRRPRTSAARWYRRRDGGVHVLAGRRAADWSASTPSWRCCRRWSRPTCQACTSGWRCSRW